MRISVAGGTMERLGYVDSLQDRWDVRRQELVVPLGAFALSLVLVFPADLIEIAQSGRGYRFHLLETLSADPWNARLPELPQYRLRILLGLLAHYLALPPRVALWLPVLANAGFLYLVFKQSRRLVPFSVAALTTVLLSTTLTVVSSQNWAGIQDSFCHLAVVAAMLSRSPAAVAGCLFVGALADERIFAVAPLVLLFKLACDGPREEPGALTWGSVRRVLPALGGVLAAFAAWCAYAAWMWSHLGLAYSDGIGQGVYPWETGRRLIPLGIYMAFRAGWAFVLLPLFFRGERLVGALLLAGAGVVLVPSVLVADVSRLSAFAFPALLIGLYRLHSRSPAFVGSVLPVVVLLNLVSPLFQLAADDLRPQHSVAVWLARALL